MSPATIRGRRVEPPASPAFERAGAADGELPAIEALARSVRDLVSAGLVGHALPPASALLNRIDRVRGAGGGVVHVTDDGEPFILASEMLVKTALVVISSTGGTLTPCR